MKGETSPGAGINIAQRVMDCGDAVAHSCIKARDRRPRARKSLAADGDFIARRSWPTRRPSSSPVAGQRSQEG